MKIFVSVGSQKFQLNRLLKELDTYAKNAKKDVDIFAQIGYSTYLPENYHHRRFLLRDEFTKYLCEADLLIIHAGAGTIMEGLMHQKRIIVYPRRAKYKEHIDDHQLDIAQEFAKQKYVLVCDGSPLDEIIEYAETYEFNYCSISKSRIPEIVNSYIFDTE